LMKEWLVSDPDLFVLLKLCQHNNIAIAIGSNSIRSRIEWIVNMMGLSSYFHTIIWAWDVSSHKPDPEVWTSAASQLGVSHSECLVVEDGFPGLVGAWLCGMQGLYYHRFTSPDRQCLDLSKYHTDTFSDIIKLLTGLPSCND
jgi:beta-phosphoglucomutase-like phosphatase (HAD superfamily)